MRFVRGLRPSPAIIVALLALAVASSSGAYAVSLAKQKGDKIIKVDSLSGDRLKTDTVTGNQIKESTLGKVPSSGKADLASHLPTLVWHPVTLMSPWSTYQPTSPVEGGAAMYTKDAEGFVHLKGAVDSTKTADPRIGTLPVGFRPAAGAWVPLGTSRGALNPYAAAMLIEKSGVMWVVNDDGSGVGANNAFVSLEGVEFYAG